MNVTLDNYKVLDFDTIDIQDEWNMPVERENRMHSIHAYPAKFPAFITTRAIRKAEERNIVVNTVADIFCGCGTVALETACSGKNFWGCDINPVATLIAETKSHVYEDDLLTLYYKRIVSVYWSATADKNADVYKNERILHWFDERHIDDLFKLRQAIYTIEEKQYRDFFLCAFSNILKPCSLWLTKSIKPQIDPNKRCKDVFGAFDAQVKMMFKANSDNKDRVTGRVEIERVNFLSREFKEPFVDLVVTSPPYVTSYEYADLHQLSTLWLEYADDFRILREGTIGSLFHSNEFKDNVGKLNDVGYEIVFKMYVADKVKARAVAQYFIDMQNVIGKVKRMLNYGGACLFVIGNTEYKGVKIDNAKHLTECLLTEGFNDIEVDRRKISNKILTPFRDRNGRFTNASRCSRKVYSEEFVIFAKK